MSTPFIQADIKEALLALGKLAGKMDDLRPVMSSIANTMHESVMQNFELEGRSASPWKTLSASTIAQRGKAKPTAWPGKILDRGSSAGLKSSITAEYDAKSAIVGTNKPYAAIHQFGGKAGRGLAVNIPARPFIWLGEEEIQELQEIIEFYLARE